MEGLLEEKKEEEEDCRSTHLTKVTRAEEDKRRGGNNFLRKDHKTTLPFSSVKDVVGAASDGGWDDWRENRMREGDFFEATGP